MGNMAAVTRSNTHPETEVLSKITTQRQQFTTSNSIDRNDRQTKADSTTKSTSTIAVMLIGDQFQR